MLRSQVGSCNDNDSDTRVQFQLACTLGQLPGTQSFEALKQIAVRHLEDSWFQIAALSAAGPNPGQWLKSVWNGTDFAQAPHEGRAEFLRRITSIIGARQTESESATPSLRHHIRPRRSGNE